MDIGFLLTFLVIFHLVPLFLTQEFDQSRESDTCPKDFQCGNLENLTFPFTNTGNSSCGLCTIECDAKPFPIIKLDPLSEQQYWVKSMSVSNFRLHNPELQNLLKDHDCRSFFHEIYLPHSPSVTLVIVSNITLVRCKKNSQPSQKEIDYFYDYGRRISCEDFNFYYRNLKSQSSDWDWEHIPTGCEHVVFPIHSWENVTENTELFQMLTADFDLKWHLSDECYDCRHKGGFCDQKIGGHEFHCSHADTGKKKSKIILGAALGGVAILMIAFTLFLALYCRKGIKNPFYLLSRKSSESPSKPDVEGGSVYFGVPVFFYAELEEVTNNFDASNELGAGGFGTVYYGKLRDGREVAVKRLYEHNYKRMAQFMNEVEILTRLRHPNLVSLYGCTSRQSRELLLVYEYIPNGTVADHLHGDRAKDQVLTWPIRMSIAIETASALAYLHASDIIHRDVKTNNILLDHNFQVKFADFGLSRLFPNDVSHISTAPQGTPGYVDPEYHQCYQLTDKSDVYSFGVVLIELISSMPAVDISRHRHEINLANLAINRIQRNALNELIDPSLGYELDPEIMRMTTSVAELALRCLQLEKEMRPTMDEVLEILKAIQDCNENSVEMTNETNGNTGDSRGRMVHSSPELGDSVSLKKNVKFPSSPNSVTEVWVKGVSTTI